MAIYGTYRGICLDNRDPLGLGRIRAQVPPVLGSRATGWAFPSWSQHDLSIWPEDRLPEPGQGVWIQFEGIDRLTWTAVFGPQEFSEQHRETEPGYYEASIDWYLGPLPVSTTVPISGTMVSPGGTPTTVAIFQRSPDGSAWTDCGESALDADGAFEFEYARPPEETGYLYRVFAPGEPPFAAATSDARTTPQPTFQPQVAWNFTPPPWQSSALATGTLRIDGDPTRPVVGAVLLLYGQPEPGAPWTRRRDQPTATTAKDGTWQIRFTRTKSDTTASALKVVFAGDSTYGYAESSQASLPAVEIPVPISWTPFVPPVLNVPYTVTGSVSVVDPYGLSPTPDVFLQVRAPSITTPPEGTWVSTASAVPDVQGRWSMAYTPDKPSADYRVMFPGSSVWLPSTSTESTSVVALTTTLTTPVFPTLTYGATFAISGTVRDQLGRTVGVGYVQLERRLTNGPTTTWSTYGPQTAVGPTGNYTISLTGPTFVGPAEWRVQYLSNPAQGYLAGVSPLLVAAVGLGTTTLSTGAFGEVGTCGFSWTAVSGATRYDVQANAGSWYDLLLDQTITSASVSGMSHMTTYEFRVRPKAQDAGGNWIFGAYSASIRCSVGRNATVKSGSLHHGSLRPLDTGTWRNDGNGWTTHGDSVLQGYYSNSAWNAFGVLSYDGAEFRNWVAANYGADVVNNLNFTETRVAMFRATGSGSGAAIPLMWYVTGSVPDQGGQPALAGGAQGGALATGASAYVTLPYAHWGKHVLLNENLGGLSGVYVVNSLALYSNGTANYAKFHGMSYASNAGDMQVWANWNFTSVAAVASQWL